MIIFLNYQKNLSNGIKKISCSVKDLRLKSNLSNLDFLRLKMIC